MLCPWLIFWCQYVSMYRETAYDSCTGANILIQISDLWMLRKTIKTEKNLKEELCGFDPNEKDVSDQMKAHNRALGIMLKLV